jgi:TolA-binding protein
VVAPAHPVSSGPLAAADGIDGYNAAMDLLRGGRNDEAAAAFHAFVLSQPGAPQTEDASFLEAVALARAGRSDAAGLAAEHHLASYPGSFHRKEAATLIARAAAQRGR